MSELKFKTLKLYIIAKRLLDLKNDLDEQGSYEIINSGAEFKSGNAWGLICAIFIASIGLNVNSTAVIIGAMLISPLMGPIVGAGYSLGTHDFILLKKSTTNLFYAIAISITASTLFFLFSPTGGAQSELLARTQPTFFDVLIAFFGGAAGIVATTRKIKGNAIPGVAIATALMPPLCTVGYGLANLELAYVAGAFYLFSINATFILISTYLFTRLLGFQLKEDRNPKRDKMIHRAMTWSSIAIVIPSLIMAWFLHKKTSFENNANLFLNNDFVFSNTFIASKEIQFELAKPKIKVKLFGEPLTNEAQFNLRRKIKNIPALSNADLILDFIGRDSFTINDLEKRFVTKNEISQIIKVENTRQQSDLAEVALKITNKINSNNFPVSVKQVHLSKNSIEIVWVGKPSKTVIQAAEKISYELLLNEAPIFYHSVIIK